jgi:hypothetical protein
MEQQLIETFIKENYNCLNKYDKDEESIQLKNKSISVLAPLIKELNNYKQKKENDENNTEKIRKETNKFDTIKHILKSIVIEEHHNTINEFVLNNKETLTLDVKYNGFLYNSGQDHLCCDPEQKYFNSVPYDNCDFKIKHGSISLELYHNKNELLTISITIFQKWTVADFDRYVYYNDDNKTLGNRFEIKYYSDLSCIFDNDNVDIEDESNYKQMYTTIYLIFKQIYRNKDYNNKSDEIYPNDIASVVFECIEDDKTQLNKTLNNIKINEQYLNIKQL